MNILVDIGHPGHVHLFRNLVAELRKQGHRVSLTCRDVPVITQLLDFYNLEYTITGKKKNSLLQKYLYQGKDILAAWRTIRKEKATMGIGVSMILPLISKTRIIDSIAFDDDDRKVTPVFAFFAGMADAILTPASLSSDNRGRKHITYNGFHELAYLHPKRFTPDPAVLKKLGITEADRFFLLRFNSFQAHHDTGESGMTWEQKIRLIRHLEPHGKIFISTESVMAPEFSAYALPVHAGEMHSVLAYAALYIGESQTMTSEAAILGTPALKCNTFAGRLSVPNELEQKYGLCYSWLPGSFGSMLEKVGELLADPDLKQEWSRKRQKMLSEKIDVTAFFAWFIGNWPDSLGTVKEQPDYPGRFK
jgi:uncharacterized protein